jgi:APA family basic amino acid/polyamine antiporter
MNFLFFGFSAMCLFILRRRDAKPAAVASPGFRAPGHPYTTLTFISVCWLIVIDTIYKYPANSLTGFAILLLGVPVYGVWSYLKKKRNTVA